MLEFFTTHWASLLVVLAFAAVCVILCRRGATPYVKQMLFYLVTEAERHFGGGTGDLKYAAVTTWIYEKLPTVVRFFFTARQIDKLIEDAVNEMQTYLSKNGKAAALVSTNLLIAAIPAEPIAPAKVKQ